MSNNNKQKVNRVLKTVKQSLSPAVKTELKSLIKNSLKMGGGVAGGIAGNFLGNGKMGRKLGKGLGAKLSKLVGSGDYAANTEDIAVNSLVKAGANQYASFGDNTSSVRIQHREYLRDIYTGPTAGAFNYTTVAVNPGLHESFPYLAGIASNFEEYRVSGIVYEVVSTTSPYNSASAMGSIVMAMQYNASSPPFSTKPQMENSDFAISARFDKSLMYGIECKDLATNNLYVRAHDISARTPLTSTDVGLLQIATQPSSTFPTNSTIGELWVSYDIEFLRPHISDPIFSTLSLSYESATFSGYMNEAVGVITNTGATGWFTDGAVTEFPESNTLCSLPLLPKDYVIQVTVPYFASGGVPIIICDTPTSCSLIPDPQYVRDTSSNTAIGVWWFRINSASIRTDLKLRIATGSTTGFKAGVNVSILSGKDFAPSTPFSPI